MGVGVVGVGGRVVGSVVENNPPKNMQSGNAAILLANGRRRWQNLTIHQRPERTDFTTSLPPVTTGAG